MADQNFDRNISAENAKREYELFVYAYEDPSFSYGTGKGWRFSGDPDAGWREWGIKKACADGAWIVKPFITVNPGESCIDPAKLVTDIFKRVLGRIPDKDKKNYGQLILAFKTIGKVKLNRLKQNPEFVRLCDEISNLPPKSKQRKTKEGELSSLVLDTLFEILSHVPACKVRDDFVKFVFTDAELGLNGNNRAGRQVQEVAFAGRSGPAAAGADAAGVGNIGNGPRAENEAEAVVAVANGAVNGAVPAAEANGAILGVNGAGPAAAANGAVNGVNGAGAAAAANAAAANAAARRTRRRPALTPAAAAELAAMARRQAAANAPADVVDRVINRVKTNTREGLQGKLSVLQGAIEKAETSGVPTNRQWLRNIGYPLRNRYISEIAKKNGVNVNNSENLNNSARPSSFKGLRLRRNNQSTRRKNRKASRKNKNTRRH